MHRSTALAAIIVATLAACRGDPEQARIPPQGDYAVYAAALDSLVLRAGGDKRIVLLTPTVGDGPEGTASVEAVRDDADVPTDVRADFMRKNAVRVPLHADSLGLNVAVTVVAPESVSALALRDRNDIEGHWDAIFAAFPGARSLVHVSRVGFSGDSSRALLYLGRTCGDLCGTGWKLQFARDSGALWRIVAAQPVWYQ